MSKRRKFQRPLGERRYRKLFTIAVEGIKTEPQYFALFNDLNSVIRVHCLKTRHHSSPLQVLKRMAEHLRREALGDTDEAWLVVDKDQWTNEQLDQLHTWANTQNNHGLALSNPNFEYWLLLHFEEGTGIASTRDCIERLKRHFPDYDKSINTRKITPDNILEAVRRAKLRDNPPCQDWPRVIGGTTVYKLVENILKAGEYSLTK